MKQPISVRSKHSRKTTRSAELDYRGCFEHVPPRYIFEGREQRHTGLLIVYNARMAPILVLRHPLVLLKAFHRGAGTVVVCRARTMSALSG